jgi:hypothetical protein
MKQWVISWKLPETQLGEDICEDVAQKGRKKDIRRCQQLA